MSFFTFLAGWLVGKGFLSYDMLLSIGITSVALLILLLGYERIHQYLLRRFVRSLFTPPIKIGLLGGYVKDAETEQPLTPTWSEFSIGEWYDRLRREFVVEKIASMKLRPCDVEQYAIIVNPFGEIYPEEDMANLTTLRNIKNYVCKGGVFVNVAGQPFFYKKDTREGPRTTGLTGQLIETYRIFPIPNSDQAIAVPSIDPRSAFLMDTWLFKNFGIRTNIVDRPKDQKVIEVYPVEDDYFRERQGDFDKVIATIRKVSNKLSKKRSLD